MLTFRSLAQGINALLFPPICPCCGDLQSNNENLICAWCIDNLFEQANPYGLDQCTEAFLPENIAFQDALWRYDKGGYVQELLVKLKYHGIATIGVQLGCLLGIQLMKNPAFQNMEDHILIPVPLHHARKRKRGYNQSACIAEGISSVTGIPIIEEGSLKRSRNTHTQTGFNLNMRMANLKDAFTMQRPATLADRFPVIVDDVFTTGTTTFELAATIKPFTSKEIGIVTVALA
ncbi:MAG: ComF family protein [Balneolales bacterium]